MFIFWPASLATQVAALTVVPFRFIQRLAPYLPTSLFSNVRLAGFHAHCRSFHVPAEPQLRSPSVPLPTPKQSCRSTFSSRHKGFTVKSMALLKISVLPFISSTSLNAVSSDTKGSVSVVITLNACACWAPAESYVIEPVRMALNKPLTLVLISTPSCHVALVPSAFFSVQA